MGVLTSILVGCILSVPPATDPWLFPQSVKASVRGEEFEGWTSLPPAKAPPAVFIQEEIVAPSSCRLVNGQWVCPTPQATVVSRPRTFFVRPR